MIRLSLLRFAPAAGLSRRCRIRVVDEPAVDVSGTIGIGFQPPRTDQRNWPVSVFVDDFALTWKQ
jgi:hypothetical protein